MKKYELKPCPICGAPAVIEDRNGVGLIKCSKGCEFLKHIKTYSQFYDFIDYYYIVLFQFGNHVSTKKKEAVAKWNAFEAPKGEAGTKYIVS